MSVYQTIHLNQARSTLTSRTQHSVHVARGDIWNDCNNIPVKAETERRNNFEKLRTDYW